jgi:hypothetical protein
VLLLNESLLLQAYISLSTQSGNFRIFSRILADTWVAITAYKLVAIFKKFAVKYIYLLYDTVHYTYFINNYESKFANFF